MDRGQGRQRADRTGDLRAAARSEEDRAGAGGQTIKRIGQDSRLELQEFLGRKVHLFLFVKVRERWSEDPERFTQMGLEFPKSG